MTTATTVQTRYYAFSVQEDSDDDGEAQLSVYEYSIDRDEPNLTAKQVVDLITEGGEWPDNEAL